MGVNDIEKFINDLRLQDVSRKTRILRSPAKRAASRLYHHANGPIRPSLSEHQPNRNCWQNYVDYHRCVNLKGEDFEPCKFFFKNFTALCPMDWVEKWDDQRDAGSFPAKL